ncbi:pre-B-cell leukemia transcription factor-interacting protein 1 [Python bivittatus]|uniref:Pre-B-cell leukemia transcription factor-interacting protein 1 n=1 Tax=Python bivittatus TaxID=176946 RepID=A0A9F2RAF1_PYTBI|nr:pre-B-cell leukemia transcription factor-interacting protein 1 [Python bivittatus]
MAEHSNSQELENNSWVITGSEAPPIEDLGFEASEETQLEASSPENDLFVDTPDLEEDKSKSPETDNSLISRDDSSQVLSPEATLLPLLDEKETESQNPEEEHLPIVEEMVAIPQTGPLQEGPHTSSIGEEPAPLEADVEGLRRRKGHLDVRPVGPEQSHDQAKEDEESDGLSKTKWLLAILAVVGFGVLATLGVILDTEDGALDMLNVGLNGEEPYPASGGRDWSPSPDSAHDAKLRAGKEQLSLAEVAGDPKSLDAMGVLLDKLAKENQDIRLMQAELQAQKEELQALLQKSEGESLAASSLQQNLAAENSRLVEALHRETAALSAARGEIQLLQEKLHSPDQAGDVKSRQHPEEEPGSRRPSGKPEPQEKEVHRLRSLLASLRHGLARAIQKAPLEELKSLEQRLARELDLGVAEKGAPWKESPKPRQGKAKPWQRKHHGEERVRHQDRDPKAADERGPAHPKRHPTPPQTKPPKGGDPQRGHRKGRKPLEPRELWGTLAEHPFSVPHGCSGVAECAQQEGLAPVQKAPFLKLVQNYLAGLGWGEYSSQLLPVLEGFFGSDGVFAHDRITFVDFLDEVEDALEELAQHLGVSDEEVDDFEEVVLKQLGAAPGRRLTRGDGAKERNREGPLHKNRAHG